MTAIAPPLLRAHGIDALIIDLDNTLSRWNDRGCDQEVAAWLQGVRAAGIAVCVVSNNGPERVGAFCARLGADVPWIAHARKPLRAGYRRALQRLRADPARTAVIGDQVFTDVLGARRAGLRAILVRPLARREFPLTRLLRLVEAHWLRRLQASGRMRSL